MYNTVKMNVIRLFLQEISTTINITCRKGDKRMLYVAKLARVCQSLVVFGSITSKNTNFCMFSADWTPSHRTFSQNSVYILMTPIPTISESFKENREKNIFGIWLLSPLIPLSTWLKYQSSLRCSSHIPNAVTHGVPMTLIWSMTVPSKSLTAL